MEQVIKFENNKYIWKDIEGKGKCLVPYKNKTEEFLNRFSSINPLRGHVFVTKRYNTYVMVSSTGCSTWGLVVIGNDILGNRYGGPHTTYRTLKEKLLNEFEYVGHASELLSLKIKE